MSLFNWMIDLDQQSNLSRQDEQIKELRERIEVLEGWIRYYENQRAIQQEEK